MGKWHTISPIPFKIFQRLGDCSKISLNMNTLDTAKTNCYFKLKKSMGTNMENLNLNILSFINLFGFIWGIFFIIILLKMKKGCRQANIILAAFIFSICLIILNSFLMNSDTFYLASSVFKFLSLAYLLSGPLLFFYIKALIFEDFKITFRHLLHFFPFVLNVFLYMPFYLEPIESKLGTWDPDYYSVYLTILLILRLLHLIIYFRLCLILLSQYKQRVNNIIASPEHDKLNWIRILIYVYGIFLGFLGILAVFRLFEISLFQTFTRYMSIGDTLLIIFISYKGLISPDIFKINTKKPKPPKATLGEEETQQYLGKIKNCMETKKPFLNSLFGIQDLSKLVSIPYWHISRIINEQLNQNFFEFINHYRIEEAKQKILEVKESRSMLEIAYDVGFNSKSAFNSAFKKITGQTPSQFRQTHT
jgi:AraC-like DNA-binding protein